MEFFIDALKLRYALSRRPKNDEEHEDSLCQEIFVLFVCLRVFVMSRDVSESAFRETLAPSRK